MYKINTEKICTYDLDDILIFYYDFHSFLQSDAGVETNLLIMFKVFIIFFPERFFFSKLMKAVVYFIKKKEPYPAKTVDVAYTGCAHNT